MILTSSTLSAKSVVGNLEAVRRGMGLRGRNAIASTYSPTAIIPRLSAERSRQRATLSRLRQAQRFRDRKNYCITPL
ncbi:MAG TPA: hypothetical protein V6C85_22405 [Allocoleopsis sp.]